jgi:hypothetical protein
MVKKVTLGVYPSTFSIAANAFSVKRPIHSHLLAVIGTYWHKKTFFPQFLRPRANGSTLTLPSRPLRPSRATKSPLTLIRGYPNLTEDSRTKSIIRGYPRLTAANRAKIKKIRATNCDEFAPITTNCDEIRPITTNWTGGTPTPFKTQSVRNNLLDCSAVTTER